MFKPKVEQWQTKKVSECSIYLIVNLYIRGKPICEPSGGLAEFIVIKTDSGMLAFHERIQRILRNT